MKNVELKLQLDKFDKIISALKRIGAKYKSRLHQTDTYYNDKNGRLKIRENNGNDFELIFYRRPDRQTSKISYYLVSKIEKSQLKKEKNIHKEALGEKVIVRKQRDLWLYRNTRVHLDKVMGLGNFLELETVVEQARKNAKKEHQEVINLLNLSDYKPCAKSYSDMLLN